MKTQILFTAILLFFISTASSGADFFNFDSLKNKEDQSISVFPNPLNEKGIIKLQLEEDTDVLIEFYALTGQKAKQLKLENLEKGTQQINIETTDLKDGVYICRVTTNKWIKGKRVIVKQQ